MYIRADNGIEEEVAGAVAADGRTVRQLTTFVNNAISDDVGSGNDSHVDLVDDDTFENILRIALMGTRVGVEVRDPRDAQGGQRLDREHLGELVEVGAPAPARVPRVEGRASTR